MTLIGSRFATVRKRLGMSQGRFCKAVGISLATLHDWEQGVKQPSGAAMALLRLLEHDPEAVIRTLNDKPKRKGR